MARFPRTIASAILLAANLSGISAEAQNTTTDTRQFVRISEIRLKPDSMRDWVELQKSQAIPLEKKAGFQWRQVWTSGNEFFNRIIVEPIPSLADLDGPNAAVKVLGAQESAALHGRIQQLVTGVRSTIATTRPELGYGAMPPTPRLALLTIIDVTNGYEREFQSFIQTEVAPALKKGGAPWFSVVQVVFGDDVNRYFAIVPVSNYAEIAKGTPLERALGPQGVTNLSEKSRTFVSRMERRIIRYLADLSYGPGE